MEILKQIPSFKRLEQREGKTILIFEGVLGGEIEIEVTGEVVCRTGEIKRKID